MSTKNKRSLEDVKPLNKTYKYVLDENNKYHRIGADDMTRMFEQLVVTPKGNKYNFVPKYIDNSEKAAELRDKMLSRQYTKGFVGEPGLELIHPEFDILSLSPIIKKGSLLRGTKNVSNKGKAPLIIRNIDTGLNNGQKDLLYHLDYGDNIGAFSNKGAYIKNNKLVPGKSKKPEQLDYIWFNEGKPFSTAVNGKSFNRAIIMNKNDVPNLIRVRESKVPIGQWTGNSGFIRKSEMVTPSEVPLQNAYIYNKKDIPLIGSFWLRTK